MSVLNEYSKYIALINFKCGSYTKIKLFTEKHTILFQILADDTFNIKKVLNKTN